MLEAAVATDFEATVSAEIDEAASVDDTVDEETGADCEVDFSFE